MVTSDKQKSGDQGFGSTRLKCRTLELPISNHGNVGQLTREHLDTSRDQTWKEFRTILKVPWTHNHHICLLNHFILVRHDVNCDAALLVTVFIPRTLKRPSDPSALICHWPLFVYALALQDDEPNEFKVSLSKAIPNAPQELY